MFGASPLSDLSDEVGHGREQSSSLAVGGTGFASLLEKTLCRAGVVRSGAARTAADGSLSGGQRPDLRSGPLIFFPRYNYEGRVGEFGFSVAFVSRRGVRRIEIRKERKHAARRCDLCSARTPQRRYPPRAASFAEKKSLDSRSALSKPGVERLFLASHRAALRSSSWKVELLPRRSERATACSWECEEC